MMVHYNKAKTKGEKAQVAARTLKMLPMDW
jgi:hypothetical protein